MSVATQASRAVKLFGTEVPDSTSRILRAGKLSVELDNGALRYIRLDGVEVLRAIAFLVRDENWGTFQPEIADLRVEEGRDGFRVSYRARCGDAGRRLAYEALIVGRPDGSLDFAATATAETDFLTNRTGFIVLHPLAGCAGCPVRIEHVDGSVTTDRFPEIVNPMQPFHDIRSIGHEVSGGLWATCRMEGDIFEMEDHRNWTDASYKTYVRPLALPWPYTIPAGTVAKQSVSLTFSGQSSSTAGKDAREPVRVEIGRKAGSRMPRIGLGVPAEEARHALAVADLVKQAGPQLLVCQLDPRMEHGVPELKRYRQLGVALDAAVVLEIVVPCRQSPAQELAAIADAVAKVGLAPAAIIVSPAADLKAVLPGSKAPPVPPLDEIYAAARRAFPGVRLGGGMFSYFTELNRKRPPADRLDFVTHTTCPIVHAADDRSVMETLAALPYVIQSTKAFIGGKPYRVGPSAIAARDNPYGASTAANPSNGRVCLAKMDPRQRGLFGAAWTLGYIAGFARGGLEAVTIGAPTGPAGIVYRRMEHPQPYYDGLTGPTVYPAYHVIAGLAAAAGRESVEASSSAPSRIEAIAWQDGAGRTLWLANLTSDEQPVALVGESGRAASLSLIDEDSFEALATAPRSFGSDAGKPSGEPTIVLGPYAVARLGLTGA